MEIKEVKNLIEVKWIGGFLKIEIRIEEEVLIEKINIS